MEFKRVVNVIPLTRVALSSSPIFTYIVPLKLNGQIRPGHLVWVPFGPRKLAGVVSSPEVPRVGEETKKLKAVFDLVLSQPVMTEKGLALANWISKYYSTSLGLVAKAMLPKLVRHAKEPRLVGHERYNPDFVLTEYQRQAVAQINASLGQSGTFLLYGVTGSGKTEVYMQIIERILEKGQQVIVLVPEISLTPQAVERFSRRFGIKRLAILHSRLRPGERFWMWEKIRSGERQIIIGPRSAVFAPVQNLGLIVLDEEHDSSYKQYDQNPKYHAREVAKQLGLIWKCPLILGDATPSLESFYQAVSGNFVLLRLPYRIKADAGLPEIKIVDMKKEPPAGKPAIFSDYLRFGILNNLKRGKQVILFLNRRGLANFVMCNDCGQVLRCERCSVGLVWHGATKKLFCHHCGKAYPYPASCLLCQGVNLKHFGIGTQAVEQELLLFLKKELKEAAPTVVRMDRDTTGDLDSQSQIYEEWSAGKIRILIGTQMISKGWDISRVGLVGIISADTVLYLPDFRMGERVFQTLLQVAGRTGRGKDPGEVILQTYNPDNYVIQSAKLHDYEFFYKKEIKERETFFYPPFSKLVKLRLTAKDPLRAVQLGVSLLTKLEQKGKFPGEIIGPTPAFIHRLRGKYQYYLILRLGAEREFDLFSYLKDLPATVDIDVDPESLL